MQIGSSLSLRRYSAEIGCEPALEPIRVQMSGGILYPQQGKALIVRLNLQGRLKVALQ